MADRNLSVVLGWRAMTKFGDESGQSGKDAFEKQREQASKEAGSVGLGAAHDVPFVPRVAVAVEENAIDIVAEEAKIAAPGKTSVPAGKGKGTPQPKVEEAAKKGSAPKTVEFSEEDAGRLLSADANIWPKILEAETKRAEGPRVAIATLLLEHGPKAKTEVMPRVIIDQLKALVPKTE